MSSEDAKSQTAYKVISREISEEMKTSYLDYAMSVLIARALPDVRDGLKPVQRRVLYAMYHDLGLMHNKPHRKSARIIGECFAKDTLILTNKGITPIQDVKRGDVVFTQSGKRKVSELYIMPKKALIKIVLTNGLANIVTPNQKFKVLNKNLEFEWKEAKDLTAEDYLVIKAEFPVINKCISLGRLEEKEILLNQELAYALGLLISDGWLEKKSRRLYFFSTSQNVMDKIKHALFNTFGYESIIEDKNYEFEQNGLIVIKKAYQIRINKGMINKFLIEKLRLHDIEALTKKIPAQIFNSPHEVIFSFVSGLIEGDGSIHASRNVIHYGSISENLIDQLQILLQHFGIFGIKYTEFNQNCSKVNGNIIKGRFPFFSIEFSSHNANELSGRLKLFSDKEQRAKKLLNKKMKQNEFDFIPYSSNVIFNELSKKHIGSGWYIDKNKHKFRQGIKYPTGAKIRYSKDLKIKHLGRRQIIEWGIKEKLARIGSEKINFLDTVFSKNLHFIKVNRIEEADEDETYDIGVEEDHEFIANGMVSHNCLGKYHPHSESAVYDTMVRMAQEFSLRYPLIDGQGNWGSVDGDSAAAIRYTEARLSKIAEELLFDIEKETVNFIPNFDASLSEPTVLPSKIPNLLINGSSGIAVGMATNIPPHNLGEVADAITACIDNPEMSIDEIMQHIKGPDFPTGGIICGVEGVKQAYKTGKGLVTVRAKTSVEQNKDRKRIIVTEIPFQVNKAQLIEEMAKLVHEKRITGISDLRDESDKEGLRIVIELKKDSNPDITMNQIYSHTKMESTFGIIMIALKNNEPKTLNIKEVVNSFISHRKEVITRRTEYERKKAEEKAHLLEGILIALKNIERIIDLIKKSKDAQEAKTALCAKYAVSEKQALAILDMRLQRLASLEQEKIKNEHSELIQLIQKLKEILSQEKKILDIIKQETLEIKQRYADKRRTTMGESLEETDTEDLIPKQEVIVTITRNGYIKRLPTDIYKQQKRGGKGVIAAEIGEQDLAENIFIANTHSHILFFTDQGTVHWLKVYKIPEATRQATGKAIVNLLELGNEKITASIPVNEFDDKHYLIMATKKGTIKKTNLNEYSRPRKGGITAITLEENDDLIAVELSDGNKDIILATRNGLAARFKESDVRATGRSSQGVKGMKLKFGGDEIIGMAIAEKEKTLLTITENGYGKRTPIEDYRLISRGGIGVINIQATERNGKAVVAKSVSEDDELMIISKNGIAIRIPSKDISIIGRNTQGVRMMKLDEKDKIVDVAIIPKENNHF